MAGWGKPMTNLIQSGIIGYIHRSPITLSEETTSTPKSKCPPPRSPEATYPPSKKPTITVNQKETMSKPIPPPQLPLDLQLLYDSLIDKIDNKLEPVETKLITLLGEDFNIPNHVNDVCEMKTHQTKLERKINKVEKENENLNQKITNLEDKMLEHNIVISGLSEDKWEDREPRCDKINMKLASVITGSSIEEKLEKAKKLEDH